MLLRRLEGLGLTQTPVQSLIDYFRRTSRGTRDGRVRDAVSCWELGIDGDQAMASIPDHRAQNCRLGSPENLQEVERLCRGLKASNRAAVVLSLVWGFTAAEIGFLFGLTESRISQVWSAATRVIAKRMENDSKPNATQLRGLVNSSEFQPALESLGLIERPMLLLSLVYSFDHDDLGFVFGTSELIAKRRIEEIRSGVASVLNYETLMLHQKKRAERDAAIAKDQRIKKRLRDLEQRMERAREKRIDRVLFQKHREVTGMNGASMEVEIEECVEMPAAKEFVAGEIEDGIAIPEGSSFGPREKSPARLLAEKMKVGQSVVVDETGYKKLMACGKPTKKKFVARRIEQNKYRVWCKALVTPEGVVSGA